MNVVQMCCCLHTTSAADSGLIVLIWSAIRVNLLKHDMVCARPFHKHDLITLAALQP